MPGSSGVALGDRAGRARFTGAAVAAVVFTGVIAGRARLAAGVGSARSAGARINVARTANSKRHEHIGENFREVNAYLAEASTYASCNRSAPIAR